MKGEYAKRDKILTGLKLEDVTKQLALGVHTIYDELWHTVQWQKVVVNNDQELYEGSWKNGEIYPKSQASTQQEWDSLVEEFLGGINKAVDFTADRKVLETEVEPGVTIGDCIDSLAVHNSYHLGKIVLLRQAFGIWPQKESDKK